MPRDSLLTSPNDDGPHGPVCACCADAIPVVELDVPRFGFVTTARAPLGRLAAAENLGGGMAGWPCIAKDVAATFLDRLLDGIANVSPDVPMAISMAVEATDGPAPGPEVIAPRFPMAPTF